MKAKKTAKTTDDRRTKLERVKLEKELKTAIGEIDEKGLLFLLQQAHVLIHNARVQRIAADPAATPATPATSRRPETVSIEEDESGKTIFLTIGRARKVLAPEEMKRLVRICYGAETKSDALRQLFTVLVKERKDILTDAVIGSPDSPLIKELFTAVRATYSLPDR